MSRGSKAGKAESAQLEDEKNLPHCIEPPIIDDNISNKA